MTGTDKIIFGKGVQLIVESGADLEPSYYKVGNDMTTACLATGFTRHKAANNHKLYGELFKNSSAVPISPDLDVYNQVVFPSDNGMDCEEKTPKPCNDTLEPDVTVNLASLTIFCLRVIFIKTVVFNILLTLRLWISQ
ncbi:M1-specific T cell receptor alpha chain-like [Embiotoca jacksoni]|uniref:M1-specific T cell receptor alpha chain-like n=1 Tax=Embiotoca jacksoni TaxID=100190 RepID=UPI0037047072